MYNYFFNKLFIHRMFLLLAAVALTACGGSSGKAKTSDLQGGAIQGSALDLKGDVSTISGIFFSGDGVGGGATFSEPSAIFSDGIHLYVADVRSNVIRKIVIGFLIRKALLPMAPISMSWIAALFVKSL